MNGIIKCAKVMELIPPQSREGGRALGWLIMGCAFFALPLAAQETNAPVAQPALPLAAPADQPAPVAQPVTDAAANAAPNPGAGLIVAVPAEARFTTAMNAYNSGQYTEAVTALSDFITSFPQDRHREEALYRLAESYRVLKRPDDALDAYTFQAQAYPDGLFRVNAELQRGAILFDRQKFADAIPALQYVADKGDGELQLAAKYLLGRSLLATRKEPRARALLQAIADAEPATNFSGDAAQTLAGLDDAQGKYSEALPLWQKAVVLATDPEVKATAAARGGWSALESKQPDVAERLFRIGAGAGGTSATRKIANTGLLQLIFQQKRYSDWLKVYQEATTPREPELMDSAREEILYDHGQAEFLLKHWPEAVVAFDAYLEAYPASGSAITAAYERFLADTQIDPARAPAEGDAYLKTWPDSPYRGQVQLLRAQEWSREGKFADALPLWTSLAQEPAKPDWPRDQILLELARAHDELGNFSQAATAYQNYLDALNSRPGDGHAQKQILHAQARLAVCLEKTHQLLAASNAWNTVLSLAPEGAPEQESALESLGLIYARGGPNQQALMVGVFRKLLDRFPNSPLRALAAFTVGDDLFAKRDYTGAERLLLNARNWDAKTWEQPATQRLVLGAFGMKNYNAAIGYLNEYDTLPAPADPRAASAARLPAALFYWLADTARKSGRLGDAEAYYLRVIRHPDPGALLPGAWWQLGEVQSRRKEWTGAVSSYENYRGLDSQAGNATSVLLALGRAELGAGAFDAAKRLAEQTLVQEPEGPRNAEARMLLGETAFARADFAEAAKQFALVAELFDDPEITPRAEARAADAFERAGDPASARQWREKLKDHFPDFQPAPYL
jgi:TolA-binding protein